MGMSEEKTWLTVVEAAARVKSTRRTVERWIVAGLAVEWRRDDVGRRYRVIELDSLLAWWRTTMQNSPVHQNRMRRKLIDAGETPPPVPERFKRRQESKSDAPQPGTLPESPGDAGDGSDKPTAPGSGTLARVVDPLTDMATLRGGPEYRHLTEKLKDATPGCAGIAEFTADKVEPETAAMMADICAHCPILARCRDFAITSRPAAGFWAGMSYTAVRALSAA